MRVERLPARQPRHDRVAAGPSARHVAERETLSDPPPGVGTANELIVVADTYEHADRLQSYQRLGALTTTIEVESSVHAGA